MNRKELKELVEKTVVKDFMVKEWQGKSEDFYCEVETITYTYLEEFEICDIKARYGKYVEGGEHNFDRTITFHDIRENESEDFIRGEIITILNVVEQHFNPFE